MNETREYIKRVITERPETMNLSKHGNVREALHNWDSQYTRFPDIRRSLSVIVGLTLGPLFVYRTFPHVIAKLNSIDSDRRMIESYIGTIVVSSFYLLIERIKIIYRNKRLEKNVLEWMKSERIKPIPAFDYIQLG